MPKDDRGEATGWYVRHRLLEEERRHVKQGEIARKTGIGQGHISQLKNGALQAGLPTAIRLAPFWGMTPGELVDTAIEWWTKRGGREWAIEQMQRDHQTAVARLKKQAGKPA